MFLTNDSPEVRKLYILSTICALFACIIGVIGIAGWLLNFPSFIAIDSTFIPLKFSTSVALILAALSIIFLHVTIPVSNLITKLAAIFTAIAGVLALAKTDMNILFPHWSTSQMSSSLALVFIIIGTVVALVSFRYLSYKYLQLAGVTIFFIIFKDLLAYLFSWDIFLGAGAFPAASLHSVIAISALAVSLLFVHADKGYVAVIFSKSLTGSLARRLFIFILLLPFLLLLFILFLHRQNIISPAEGLLWFALLYTMAGLIILWHNLNKINTLEKINLNNIQELSQLNQQLTATNEELFTTNENLIANNRELTSLNEQLSEATRTIEKLSADALHTSENKYKQLTDSISDIFFAFDRELKFTYWNKASEKFSGLRADQAIGKSLYELYPVLIGSTVEICYKEALYTGKYQTCIFDSKNTGKIFEVNVYPSQTGISVFTKDITRAKQVEKELKEKEERFELALWGADLGLWDWDIPSGKVIYNERWAEILGYTLEEIEPHANTWVQMVHPDDMPYINQALNKHLEGLRHSTGVNTGFDPKQAGGNGLWIMVK